ncbi:MAG: hypothetical protein U1E47_03465 [Rivihabitans pingtungensis]
MTPPILPCPPAPHRVPHWFALSYLGALVVVSLYPFMNGNSAASNGSCCIRCRITALPLIEASMCWPMCPYGVALAHVPAGLAGRGGGAELGA